MNKFIVYCLLSTIVSSYAYSSDNGTKKEIKICWEAWDPYMYEENGTPKGIAVEIVENALKRIGQDKIKWTEMVPKRCYKEVENGRSDMTLNVSYFEDKKWIHSKTVIVDWELAAIVNASSPLEKFESLSQFYGKTIGMTRGYLYPDIITKDMKKFKVDEVSDAPLNLKKLSAGRVDVVFEDPSWGVNIGKKNNLAVKVLAPSIAVDPTYTVFSPKLTKMAEQYDQAIIEMAESGEIDKIYEKATGKPYAGTARIKALKKTK